ASSLYDFKIDYSASFSSPDSYFTGLLNIHDPFFPEQTISVKSPEFTSVVLPTPVFYTGFVTDGTVKRGLFTVLPEENIVAVEGEKVGMYLIRSICPGYSMIEYKDSLFRIAMKPE
ncbi:MAG: hypothetical protein JXL67_07770, partial [Calditrichaeota bacterium]|nr:hypothetical protein [Calditrichota bacterium]